MIRLASGGSIPEIRAITTESFRCAKEGLLSLAAGGGAGLTVFQDKLFIGGIIKGDACACARSHVCV